MISKRDFFKSLIGLGALVALPAPALAKTTGFDWSLINKRIAIHKINLVMEDAARYVMFEFNDDTNRELSRAMVEPHLKIMKDKKQKPIVVSFSGGKTSAYMAKSLLDIYGDRVHFVFSNTGAEHQKTLDFIKRCQDNWNMNIIWIEAKVNHSGRGRGYGTAYTIVDYESASRDNEPFEEVIKKYGLPSPAYLHCTRELKEQPITAWANDNFGRNGYKMAIGIRADEIDRINLEAAKKRNIIYPLADWGIKLQDISGFWEMQDFTLNIPSYLGNCVACYKKTDRKLFTIARENPNYFIFFDYAGEKYILQAQSACK